MSWKANVQALKTDPVVGPLIKRYGYLEPKGTSNAFLKLTSSIISQQISGKAADAILKKVRANIKPLTPAMVAAKKIPELRSFGLSPQKASYLHDLAAKFLDGTITPKKFAKLGDEAIIAELVAVKGIGRWTAEMFLIFSLKRVNVWPVDDYGIKKAVQHQLRMRSLPDKTKMLAAGKRWAGCRSIASLYLWKSLENR